MNDIKKSYNESCTTWRVIRKIGCSQGPRNLVPLNKCLRKYPELLLSIITLGIFAKKRIAKEWYYNHGHNMLQKFKIDLKCPPPSPFINFVTKK